MQSPIQTERLTDTTAAIVRVLGSGPRNVSEWLKAVEDSEVVTPLLSRVYTDISTSRAKAQILAESLRRYCRRFGDEPVVVSRAPGRLNIMGRHVDHQGGHVNMIALDRDTWIVAGKSQGGRVTLTNVDSAQFPDREFDARNLLPGFKGQNWRAYVDEPAMVQWAKDSAGDWSQYVKSAIARFHARFPAVEPCGYNLVVSGDVPNAAGLSSSSALVVATMEALVGMHGIHVTDQEFVELCGEAEWYVGTRGGFGDHAAMKFSRRGAVTQIRFFPLEVTDTVVFPVGHVMLVCKSGIEARKSGSAKDTFNHRVAGYHIGRELFKRAHPDLAERIAHLRDLLPNNLELCEAAMLERLENLPTSASRDEIARTLPADFLEPHFASHAETEGPYPIRDLLLFGISECERSRRAPDLLRNGDVERFGQWMNISHDGDRVTPRSECSPTGFLAEMPGAYACSVPGIDRMADIALTVKGVLGAQISGAGLGGCLMVLAREESADTLRHALTEHYYEPAGIPPEIFTTVPTAGSGLLTLT